MLKKKKLTVLVIDSSSGIIHAMNSEQFLVLQLHELFSLLSSKSVATIIVLAQAGLLGQISSPIDLTYLADTVLITRYFESLGSVKKAVSVIKKRSGFHENTIREFGAVNGNVAVGKPLQNFQGILSDVPTLIRKNRSSLGKEHGGNDKPRDSFDS
jgi:circadian clock protein KaiC